jgi:hypothetical protein
LREDCSLRAWENKVLRRIFGLCRKEATEGWGELHNGHHKMAELENAYKIFVGIHEGKKQLGRSRLRWEDNIIMYLIETGCGSIDWIHLTQDMDQWRDLVNTVMDFRVP